MKVLRAYNILTGELDSSKEKGYCPGLFEGLKYCTLKYSSTTNPSAESSKKHIHVRNDKKFVANLIAKGINYEFESA